MSRKNGVMDWYFQLYNLPRILIAQHYEDLVELAFEKFDRNLHLDENLNEIKNDWKKWTD